VHELFVLQLVPVELCCYESAVADRSSESTKLMCVGCASDSLAHEIGSKVVISLRSEITRPPVS
jgi:hypothetical protein